MEWAVKARRPDEECHSLSFYQINNKILVFFVNLSHVQFIRSKNPQISKTIQNWWIQLEWTIKARRPDEKCHSLSFYQINNEE